MKLIDGIATRDNFIPDTPVGLRCRCGACGREHVERVEQWQVRDLRTIPGAFDADGFFKGACPECANPKGAA